MKKGFEPGGRKAGSEPFFFIILVCCAFVISMVYTEYDIVI